MSAEARSFRCPNCSADLKFFPDQQKFCCEYCRSEFTETELLRTLDSENTNNNARNDAADNVPSTEQVIYENTRLYACPSCGAEIVSDENTAASFCYYCHNPVILKGRVDGSFRPSKVIPFSFGKDVAVEKFNEWARQKKYIPKDLLSEKQIEKMTGLYVPFWVADADTNSRFECIGENVTTWRSGSYEYTKVKQYSVIRDMNIEYKGVPADGSKKIEDSIMEAIEPYDYKGVRDFHMMYLSGFFADKYDVPKEQLYDRIKSRMFQNNHQTVKNTCTYTALKNEQFYDNVCNVDWSYMMLPVWFMTFHYKGEIWKYAINGQTGKISGQLPIDKGKVFKHNLLVGTIVTAATMLLGYLLGGIF